MNLKNLDDVTTLNIGYKSTIEKLVLNLPFLYWINRDGDGDVIERCPISSSSSKVEVETIARHANGVTGMLIDFCIILIGFDVIFMCCICLLVNYVHCLTSLQLSQQ